MATSEQPSSNKTSRKLPHIIGDRSNGLKVMPPLPMRDMLKRTTLGDLVRCAQEIQTAQLHRSVDSYSATKFPLAPLGLDVIKACELIATVAANSGEGMDQQRAEVLLRRRSRLEDEEITAMTAFRSLVLTAARLKQKKDPNLFNLWEEAKDRMSGLQMRALAFLDEKERTSVVFG